MAKEDVISANRQKLPKIEIIADSDQIKPGKTISLKWNVTEAEEVRLYHFPEFKSSTIPLNWQKMFIQAKPVKNIDNFKLALNTSTHFVVFARSKAGLVCQSKIIDVPVKPVIPKPIHWCIDTSFNYLMYIDLTRTILTKPKELPTINLMGLHVNSAGGIVLYDINPTISLTLNKNLIFQDESLTATWNIQGADCSEMNEAGWGPSLTPDSSKACGTRQTGGFVSHADPEACSLPNQGSFIVHGSALGGGQYSLTITAKNAVMGSSIAVAVYNNLLYPQFAGDVDNYRKGIIIEDLRSAFTSLINGAIINYPNLDNEIPAFRDGHLNRVNYYHRLCAEFYNLNLITINVKEYPEGTAPDAIPWGRFFSHSNNIEIDFIKGSNDIPNNYCVIHELIHKAGFNDQLFAYYSQNQVESQAHQLSAHCKQLMD